MPFYELVMIARSQLRRSNPSLMIGNGLEMENQRLKELLKFCAKHVLDNNVSPSSFLLNFYDDCIDGKFDLLATSCYPLANGIGVVRQFTNSGPKELPYRMKRHQEIFNQGSYLTMKFDSSPQTMNKLSKALSLNETVIRHTILKMGDSLSDISSYVPPETVKPLALDLEKEN